MLEIRNLVKTYGKNESEVRAVNNISFKVKKGEFVVIMGKSGCGKSTIMHLLAGLDKPDSGKIIIDKTDITKLKNNKMTIFRRDNIGFIYQSYNLIPYLTVKENIMLPLTLAKKKVDSNYFNKLVKTLSLKERLNYFPHELSGGGKQRVGIARALITHPKIILADEPTGNLDSKSKSSVMWLLKHYNKKGQTILMVTHDEEIGKMADRVITIEDGKVKTDDTKKSN